MRCNLPLRRHVLHGCEKPCGLSSAFIPIKDPIEGITLKQQQELCGYHLESVIQRYTRWLFTATIKHGTLLFAKPWALNMESDVTLRRAWWMVSLAGFLTMAVTVWPCCSAWLTRNCPVWPVAPNTAIFILRLWRTGLTQRSFTDLTAGKFPPCCAWPEVKNWLQWSS